MDKGRRTSSIIEKFVYDPVTQSLNVSFQDLEYNVESGEMGFFEKDGDICYVSKLEIAPSGEKPYTVKFTNGDVFGSATVDGAVEFIENEGGGGGGGGGTVYLEEDEERNLPVSYDDIVSGMASGKSYVVKMAVEDMEGAYSLDAMSSIYAVEYDESTVYGANFGQLEYMAFESDAILGWNGD